MQSNQSLFARIQFIALVTTLLCSSAFATGPTDFLTNLQGCFSVNFRYIEDGVHNQIIDELYEWIAPLQNDPSTSLQHIGVVGKQAFKHWREEWRDNGNGTWTQKVLGPREDFRYECTAPFQLNQWRCTASHAPKPRRDAARTDYETLDREDTIQLTSKGWVQAENNTKRDQDGKIVTTELGWNEYNRVDNSNCQAAKDYLANPH